MPRAFADPPWRRAGTVVDMADKTGDTRYGHRSGSGANEPPRNEKKETAPDWSRAREATRPADQRDEPHGRADRAARDARTQSGLRHLARAGRRHAAAVYRARRRRARPRGPATGGPVVRWVTALGIRRSDGLVSTSTGVAAARRAGPRELWHRPVDEQPRRSARDVVVDCADPHGDDRPSSLLRRGSTDRGLGSGARSRVALAWRRSGRSSRASVRSSCWSWRSPPGLADVDDPGPPGGRAARSSWRWRSRR